MSRQYHTPPIRLATFFDDITARPRRPISPSFLTVHIHLTYIPACHPETGAIRLSDIGLKFQMPSMYISLAQRTHIDQCSPRIPPSLLSLCANSQLFLFHYRLLCYLATERFTAPPFRLTVRTRLQ